MSAPEERDRSHDWFNMMSGEWSDRDPENGRGFWLYYGPIVVQETPAWIKFATPVEEEL